MVVESPAECAAEHAQIVREEMNRAGAVELLMPALTPIGLWERTGRVEAFGNVLIQFNVKRQNNYELEIRSG